MSLFRSRIPEAVRRDALHLAARKAEEGCSGCAEAYLEVARRAGAGDEEVDRTRRSIFKRAGLLAGAGLAVSLVDLGGVASGALAAVTRSRSSAAGTQTTGRRSRASWTAAPTSEHGSTCPGWGRHPGAGLDLLRPGQPRAWARATDVLGRAAIRRGPSPGPRHSGRPVERCRHGRRALPFRCPLRRAGSPARGRSRNGSRAGRPAVNCRRGGFSPDPGPSFSSRPRARSRRPGRQVPATWSASSSLVPAAGRSASSSAPSAPSCAVSSTAGLQAPTSATRSVPRRWGS